MKFFLIIPLTICLHGLNGFPQGHFIFNPLHFIESAASAVTGIGHQMARNLPLPKDILQGSKQLLFGLPEVALFRTIHELCSLYVSSGYIEPKVTPAIDEMYFQLRTPCNSISFPIENAKQILKSPEFNTKLPTVLFISGWTSTIESDSIMHVAKAYNCRGGYNFLALNASYFIDTLYTWSAFNTAAVGHIVAHGLIQLSEKLLPQNIHLVGFSLGAHIAGFAARYFEQSTGKKIQRITGLDPANPCFGGRSLMGLQQGDAIFVDIIHTNPGALGEIKPLGDIDFYVQGLAPIKPGCTILGCSHSRAWKYYAESVYIGHENDFLATHCNMANNLCDGSKVIMGLKTPFSGRGTFKLNANANAPYGQNALYNSDLMLSQCGFCDYLSSK